MTVHTYILNSQEINEGESQAKDRSGAARWVPVCFSMLYFSFFEDLILMNK